MKLSVKEEQKRQELYDIGLSDKEIAKKVGSTVCAITEWRHDRKLKANKYRKLSITLCWICQNTHKEKCSWFNPDNPQPVEGWNAIPTVRRTESNGHIYEIHSYCVIECPNYKPMK